MEDQYKVINIHFFRPGTKTVKQRCEITYCDACSRCDLYKKGQCLISRGFAGTGIRCPHGKFRVEEGFTLRSKSYHSWFQRKAKQYGEDLVDKLTVQDTKLAVVGGDYVYLPYSHLKNYVNEVEGIVRDHFLKRSDFTVDKILEIITFRPKAALSFEEITSYQDREVPRFVQHVRERFPDLYEEFLSKYPDYRGLIVNKASTYIGRTAKIATLQQGSTFCDCHANLWTVTGNQIICENCTTSLMIPFGKGPARIAVDITDDMAVKVTDNSMVSKDTVFLD